MAEDAALFTATTRVREAVSLINDIDENKLAVVVRRLAKAVGGHGGSSAAFSGDEITQLQEHLNLSAVDLNTVLEACSYILEKAAYGLVKPEDLFAQLQTAGMLQAQARAFAGVWESEASGVLSKLRSKSLGCTPRLKSTEWNMHVNTARSDMTRLADPRAIFQLRLDAEWASEDVTMEFSIEELSGFLGKLDQIQAQLDDLS